MGSNYKLEEARIKLREYLPSLENLAKGHDLYQKKHPTETYPLWPIYSDYVMQIRESARNNIDDALLYAKYLYTIVYDPGNKSDFYGKDYREHLESLLSSKDHKIDKAPVAFLLAKYLLENSPNNDFKARGKELMQRLISHKTFGEEARKALGVGPSHYDQNMYAEEFIKNAIKLLSMGKSKDSDMGAAKKIEPILARHHIDINAKHEYQYNADYLGALKALHSELKNKAGAMSNLGRRTESIKLYEAISKIDLKNPSNKGGIETMAFHLNDKKPQLTLQNEHKHKPTSRPFS